MAVDYYLQRDLSDERSRYAVYDGRGELVYSARAKNKKPGELIHITDSSDSVKCAVRRLGFTRLSTYLIRAEHDSMRMNLAVTQGGAAVQFSGISFYIRGDVLSGSYDIIDADSTVVCAVCKDYAKSCVRLEVKMKERELFCMAAAMCIDGLSVLRAPALQMT